MKTRTGRVFQTSRVTSQVVFFLLFLFLLLAVNRSSPGSFNGSDLFFYIDPLVLLTDLAASRAVVKVLLLAIVPLVLTLFLGKFFCGWVCPLGALNQFFSFLAIRFGRMKEETRRNPFRWKYIILVLVIVLAGLGSQIGRVLDPISLLTRSTSIAVVPVGRHFYERVMPSAKEGSAWAEEQTLAAEESAAGDPVRARLPVPALVRTQALIIGAVFLGLLLLNFHRRRFYCNYVCPLGALYGLVARISPLRFTSEKSCDGCRACSRYCAYHGGPCATYSKQDCTVCFNCVVHCPNERVDVGFAAPGKARQMPIDLGRRRLMGTLASGVFLAGLSAVVPAAKAKTRGFARPPGSLSEPDFLEKCVRCGACVQACPTSFIQVAGFEAGLEALWTPVVNARMGFCEYECMKCMNVCPTGAIEPLDIEDKRLFKIGCAVVDKSRCLTYGDGVNCTVCADHCPVPGKAIRFRKAEVWNHRGKVASVNQIYVVPDLCNGCGICEYVCPRSDAAGIVLTSDDEQRTFGF